MNQEEINQEIKVNVLPHKVRVLDPSVSMLERIAIGSRTCYKSEGDSSPETDKKLIRGCIKRGHTSVLEHGAISLYLNIRPDEESATMIEKVVGRKGRPLAFRQIWDRLQTLTSQRYATSFNDPDIFEKHAEDIKIDGRQLPKNADISLPCIIANVRAWRTILGERLFIADNVSNDPVSWMITAAVVEKMSTLAPDLFYDIVAKIEDRIKSYGEHHGEDGFRPSPVDSMLFAKFTDEEYKEGITLSKFVAKFFPNDCKTIIAEETSKSLYVTIVFETDRTVTHEHVRHRRDVGYSQESQRYVNYNNRGYSVAEFTCDPRKAPKDAKVDPFSGKVDENEKGYQVWKKAMDNAFASYKELLDLGYPPETARKVLPNSCYTTLTVTWLLPLGFTNFLYWRSEEHAQYDIRLLTDKIILQMLMDDHPFLNVLGTADLIRSVEWMKKQNIFDEETMAKIDQKIKDRLEVEKELQRQAEEEHRILEEQHRAEMAKMAAGEGIRVDDHTTKPVPDPSVPPKIVKVGGNEQGATPSEPGTEQPPRVQLGEGGGVPG